MIRRTPKGHHYIATKKPKKAMTDKREEAKPLTEENKRKGVYKSMDELIDQFMEGQTVGFVKHEISPTLIVIHRYFDKQSGTYHEGYAHQIPSGKWVYVVGFESSFTMMGEDGLFDTFEECADDYQDNYSYE